MRGFIVSAEARDVRGRWNYDRVTVPEDVRSITLCYHAVSATWEDGLAVTPAAFEQQVRSLLDRGFAPVTAEQALLGEPGTFHVTFDDCFRSIHGALELLRELGVPATVFVCSALADGGQRLAVPEMTGRADGCVDELVTFSWEELREWAEEGVEIGSHTVTHPHLPRLDGHEAAEELVASRGRIEDVLGRPCRFVAYPYGESDARVRAAAQDAGYQAAFGLAESTKSPDAFAFPRVDIYRGTDKIRFWAKTSRVGSLLRDAAGSLRFTALLHVPELLTTGLGDRLIYLV